MKKETQLSLIKKLNPSISMSDLQLYFKEVFHLRGFDNQKPQDKLLLLMEEVGELAKAIRKKDSPLGIDYDRIENYDTIESETADVFILLISICNLLDINLMNAVIEKEKKNTERNWGK